MPCIMYCAAYSTDISPNPQVSAEVISKHLIMPLISVTHLAFTSADAVSEISETDLEKVREHRLFLFLAALAYRSIVPRR